MQLFIYLVKHLLHFMIFPILAHCDMPEPVYLVNNNPLSFLSACILKKSGGILAVKIQNAKFFYLSVMCLLSKEFFFGNHLKCVFLLLAFITKWIEIYSGTNLVRILCLNFQHYYFLLILNESIDKCASYGVFLNYFLLFIHGNFNWCTPPIIRSIRIFN